MPRNARNLKEDAVPDQHLPLPEHQQDVGLHAQCKDGHVLEENNLVEDISTHCMTIESSSPDDTLEDGKLASSQGVEGCSHHYSDLDYLMKENELAKQDTTSSIHSSSSHPCLNLAQHQYTKEETDVVVMLAALSQQKLPIGQSDSASNISQQHHVIRFFYTATRLSFLCVSAETEASTAVQ
ncbi:hypothetical protein Pmani_007965 [Petrolisthes manimaculis]|uniref:Uncharacterized protein n=1 Tax=Petrolisthes manimaculis TaxID=1843537 RepID=A0AAE1Q7A9_9EUCA|nr:hypothetical protein Pmani_007965 [Petrolisthes manimaculis]